MSAPLHAALAEEVAPIEAPEPSSPADLGTFIEVRNDYESRGGGAFFDATVLRGDYAFTRAFSLRAEVPLAYAATGTARDLGLGDVLIRPLGRVARARGFALLLGSDLILDSASSDALGRGKNQVAPLAIAYFGVSRAAWLSLSVQHAFSFGGDRRRPDVSVSTLRPFAVVELPHGFWLSPDERLQWNHLGAPRFTSTTVLEVGKAFGDRALVYVDPGVQVSDAGTSSWLLTGGVRLTFPRPVPRALAAAPSPALGER